MSESEPAPTYCRGCGAQITEDSLGNPWHLERKPTRPEDPNATRKLAAAVLKSAVTDLKAEHKHLFRAPKPRANETAQSARMEMIQSCKRAIQDIQSATDFFLDEPGYDRQLWLQLLDLDDEAVLDSVSPLLDKGRDLQERLRKRITQLEPKKK